MLQSGNEVLVEYLRLVVALLPLLVLRGEAAGLFLRIIELGEGVDQFQSPYVGMEPFEETRIVGL